MKYYSAFFVALFGMAFDSSGYQQTSPFVSKDSYLVSDEKDLSRNGKEIKPKAVDCSRLAFYPERWKKAGVDFEMLAWHGDHVVFITKKGEYDAALISAFVRRLDSGWRCYSNLIGRQPRGYKKLNDKPTICAIPKSNLSCGYGCGFVGSTGIEVSGFYTVDWPTFKKDPDSFQHYYFYEMGRNFFLSGDRHSLFQTGFAVFMRYVCMDQLTCRDLDVQTRRTIEKCEELYAKSNIKFIDAFTNLGSGEKRNRLKDEKGRFVRPSDQPVMYAAAMLKLRRDYGGDKWVKNFYRALRQCKPMRASSIRSAKTQIFNWLVCASLAAKKDLTSVFADRWRMPISENQRIIMASTDWTSNVNASQIVQLLVSDAPVRSPKSSTVRTAEPIVIPTPRSIALDEGAEPFKLDQNSRILVRSPKEIIPLLTSHARIFSGELELLTGLKVPVIVGANESKPNDIVLSCAKVTNKRGDHSVEDERYELVVNKTGVQVSADSFYGIAHGTSSCLQLLDGKDLAIPPVTIKDQPSAPYRALMVDVARTPHSIGVIQDAVRLCRLYKVRYLQLHLTDDQHFTFPFPPITDNLKRNFSYSLDELKNLVTYADSRGVTIIPELDLPGHSSRLRESGYLALAKNDSDIASPENYEKIGKLIDAMIEVFDSSPYFHIGGDESGAGSKLIPFLSEVNRRVRARGKRLLVWEGFHGAPTDSLPATGDDRVIVMAWESSYNAPWDLLNSGYQIINASWKPTYLTGGYGGLIHPGSTGGKRFPLKDIYRWDKNTFMHWEPGRPVFEDRGPNDPNRNDGEWNANWIGRADQMIGGQMLYWEQYECSVIHFLHPRLPFLSERLWNPEAKHKFDHFKERVQSVNRRVIPILQPIEISPIAKDQAHPVVGMYQPYTGESIRVTLRNRTKIKGRIRYSTGGWSGSLNSPNFRPVPKPDKNYTGSITGRGPLSVRAELIRDNGTPVDGHSWQFYNNWPDRVEVTEYEIGRRSLRKVPDLESLPESKIVRRYRMPYIRGLMQNVEIRGQLTRTDLVAPATGVHTLELRTQSGHATLYLDINQNGQLELDEVLVRDSPNDESGQVAKIKLKRGERYLLRIDHATGIPRPVLLLFITPPDGKREEVSKFLQLPK